MPHRTKEAAVPPDSRLKELAALFGFTSEVPPIDTPAFYRRLGQVIAAAISPPRAGHRKSTGPIKLRRHNSAPQK
jgi:hypothetical protein